MIKTKLKKVVGVTFVSLLSTSVFAAPFTEIRIGDDDGFGYDADPGFASLVGDGGPADRNGDGHLGIGDVLPSLNGDSTVATGSGDDFDNRMAEAIMGTGFIDNGSAGTEFTDISLSTSYDASSAAGMVYNAQTGTFGSGGAFPKPPSTVKPIQPGFLFDFFVADADITAGTDIFFNMVFADYDVVPAEIDFTFASSSSSIAVLPQNNGPDDGLIQGAFATLAFNDVFTWSAADSGWYGYARVDFDAPQEPYTAFDYVELSVDPLVVPVSAPSSPALILLGLGGLFICRSRAKKS